MANSTIVYACTQDGLAIVNKPGTLPEWLPPRKVLGGRPVSLAWAEPGPPIRVLALADGDLLLSESGGRNWEPAGPPSATALFSAGDPVRLYATGEGGRLQVSQDGGATWESLPPLLQGTPTQMLSTGGDEFYLLIKNDRPSLFRGNPHVGDWHPLPVEDVAAVAHDASGGKLYAATLEGVQVSSDAGDTWSTLPGSPQDGQCLVVIPAPAGKPPAVVVGTSSGLAVSPDGGETWRAVELPQPGDVTALARDPERRDRLYAGTDTGYLFESGDRGQSWQVVNAEPLSRVGYLYAIRI